MNNLTISKVLVNRETMINEVLRVSAEGLQWIDTLEVLEKDCGKLDKSLKLIAEYHINKAKIRKNFWFSMESLKKNYSYKRLVALYGRLVLAVEDIKSLDDKLLKVINKSIEKIEKKRKNNSENKTTKTTENKTYKVLCKYVNKDGSKEYVEKTSDGKETKSHFIHDLRANGFLFGDRKVKELYVYNYIYSKTDCSKMIFDFIKTVEDCEEMEKDDGYAFKKWEEYMDRRIARLEKRHS